VSGFAHLIGASADALAEISTGVASRVLGECIPRRLKLIAAGKSTQNAYIESFNGKSRDECLNDHYFNNLEHAP